MIEVELKNLANATPDAMVVINEVGTIILTNERADLMFGYRVGELSGQSAKVIIPERFRSRHDERQKIFFTDPQVRYFDESRGLYGLKRDGTEIPIMIGLAPITTQGKAAVAATIRDISRIVAHVSLLKNRWKWLVIGCIVLLHLIQGIIISFSAGAGISMTSLMQLIPYPTIVGGVLISAALFSIYQLATEKSKWFLLPQFVILTIAAGDSGRAIWSATGGRGAIAVDQLIYILLPFMYGIVIMEIYGPRFRIELKS